MNDLFVKFYMLKIDITRATDENNIDAVTKLRQELMSLWNSIISIQPETLEGRKMLGLFLLDQLSEKTPEYEVKLIRKKIIELFWETPNELSQKVSDEVVQLRKTG